MFKYILVIFLIFLMFGNDDSYAAIDSLPPMKITKAVIDSWKHTSLIGTVNAPTVDGGIINTTDELPVSHPIINPPQTVLLNKDKPTIQVPKILSNKTTYDTTSFNDDWATSEKVGNILENASKTQKLQFVLQQSKVLKLPASVALVPIVESAYQQNAISDKGAVGVWQLMPRTAIEYGLDPSQRTNFIPETKAALLLLKNLHHEFGNWELAFAAYNAGSAKVYRALNEDPNATNINELNLPIETKKYVASIYRINNFLLNTPINQFLS